MAADKNLKVAVVQMTSNDRIDDNLKFVLREIREAAAGGAKLVVFPENSLYMRLAPGSEIENFDLNSEGARAIGDLAREEGTHVLLTTPTDGNRGKARNSTIHFAPNAGAKIVYAKIHMFDVDVDGAPSVRESDKFWSGEGPAMVEIEGWRLGLSICYDVRFAELYSRYAGKVDAILVPSAFLVPTGEAHWHVLLRARAIENQSYLLAPAQGGAHRSTSGVVRKTFGHSLVVDPWGQIVWDAGEKSGAQIVELQADRLAWVRKQIPMVHHRRLLGL